MTKKRESGMVARGNYRITVLTERLLRLEYSEHGIFEDRPTVFAINREFPPADYRVLRENDHIELHTGFLSVYYDEEAFSSGGLSIKVLSRTHGIYSTWHYGDKLEENLGGTARTLDQADGEIPLENGVNSRLQGFSVLDDSGSLVISESGRLILREHREEDLYFFGYGLDYQECLNDFFKLSGKVPLLPRWTLGNWWSRFYKYSEKSYLELMDRFEQEKIPLSVAVLDMDWHVTELPAQSGKGWTGFTWNRTLFPDPEKFLGELHHRKLKTSLNLHPAEGIQPHEERYEKACAAVGRVVGEHLPIPFDFNDTDFVKMYFGVMLHPLEEEGCDLWWVDWQQGDKTGVCGADPLWLLNYYHFWNHGREGKRPVTFSRYAGPGSHRYPIGFSGDSIISWASLKFQPYFTATASNIGYGWWSHDIGGHCAGVRDEELLVRWVQFGVFSPIMRLHSTSNLFNGKEPWKYGREAEEILKDYLRFRHRLIPYLYTMNWKCHFENLALVRPMYLAYPENEKAYDMRNQYLFGTEMIVCPITEPEDEKLKLGCVNVWLPEEKNYYDFFTGMRYRGGRKISVYRPMKQIPVFVKEGAVIPLAGKEEAEKNGTDLPEYMEILVFAGESGEFLLCEDSGEGTAYQKGETAETRFLFEWEKDGGSELVIRMEKGSCPELPDKRRFCITVIGVKETDDILVCTGQKIVKKNYDKNCNRLSVELAADKTENEIRIRFGEGLVLAKNPIEQKIFERLEPMRIAYEQKEKLFRSVCEKKRVVDAVAELLAMDLPDGVRESVMELLIAD